MFGHVFRCRSRTSSNGVARVVTIYRRGRNAAVSISISRGRATITRTDFNREDPIGKINPANECFRQPDGKGGGFSRIETRLELGAWYLVGVVERIVISGELSIYPREESRPSSVQKARFNLCSVPSPLPRAIDQPARSDVLIAAVEKFTRSETDERRDAEIAVLCFHSEFILFFFFPLTVPSFCFISLFRPIRELSPMTFDALNTERETSPDSSTVDATRRSLLFFVAMQKVRTVPVISVPDISIEFDLRVIFVKKSLSGIELSMIPEELNCNDCPRFFWTNSKFRRGGRCRDNGSFAFVSQVLRMFPSKFFQ